MHNAVGFRADHSHDESGRYPDPGVQWITEQPPGHGLAGPRTNDTARTSNTWSLHVPQPGNTVSGWRGRATKRVRQSAKMFLNSSTRACTKGSKCICACKERPSLRRAEREKLRPTFPTPSQATPSQVIKTLSPSHQCFLSRSPVMSFVTKPAELVEGVKKTRPWRRSASAANRVSQRIQSVKTATSARLAAGVLLSRTRPCVERRTPFPSVKTPASPCTTRDEHQE